MSPPKGTGGGSTRRNGISPEFRKQMLRVYRIGGPFILLHMIALIPYRIYGETLPESVPGIISGLYEGIVVWGWIVTFNCILLSPLFAVFAVRLRRDPALAAPCMLMAAFGAMCALGAFTGGAEGLAELLGYPLLFMAAVGATWAGYGTSRAIHT